MLALVFTQGCTLFVGILDDLFKRFLDKKKAPNSKWISPIDLSRKIDYSVEF
jgi:hypothetical protein